jgi:Holliday junction DNA helicase RuvA
MIALLTGRVAFKAPTHMTLDVQGVGYEVFIPLSTYYSLPDLQENVALSIHTHVREDAIQLFGFLTEAEKESFLLLTAVSGIGPKLALSVLSTLPVSDLMSSIQAGDVEKLATVPGIGKKSAARIVLELKEKASRFQVLPGSGTIAASSATGNPLLEDALSALVNLGYRAQDVREVLKRLSNETRPLSALQDVIRETLKELARR